MLRARARTKIKVKVRVKVKDAIIITVTMVRDKVGHKAALRVDSKVPDKAQVTGNKTQLTIGIITAKTRELFSGLRFRIRPPAAEPQRSQ